VPRTSARVFAVSLLGGFSMTVRRARPRARGLAGALVLALAGSTLAGSASPAAGRQQSAPEPARPSPGSAGIGDRYFPVYGNGGYQVAHYDVDVSFNPATERLRGRTVVRGIATQHLSRFNLDLVLPASKVLVNGRPAAYERTRHELVVTPRRALAPGQPMSVVVRYAGVPENVRANGAKPWVTTRDGAVALGEPEIAAWWYPSNDHPSDKASFDITLRVPHGVEAISNGRLVSRKRHQASTSWHWREDDPMATYLAFAAIGQYDVVRGQTAGGRPYLYAYSQRLGEDEATARKALRATGRITGWLSRTWGPYPFDEIGGVALGKWIGFALENQTRPVYSGAFFAFGANKRVVVHEMAHQWFGDKVALERWRHIWLNEGFATYSEWLYLAHAHGVTADRSFARVYRQYRSADGFWDVPIGAPGPRRLFNQPVYVRGAMTAHALRHKIGSDSFFRLMRTWVRTTDGDGTTGEFIRLAEVVSGQQLDRFFRVWLFQQSRPRPTVVNGFPRGF
jgi:aminopeptidase N